MSGIPWKDLITPIAALAGAAIGVLGTVLFQRRRERVTWEESAKGHLAKLRHEALAKCLAGVGHLFEMSRFHWNTDWEEYQRGAAVEEHRRKVVESLRVVAEHEFLLPPELRREVQKVIRSFLGDAPEAHMNGTDALASVVDSYMPPLDRR